MSEPIDGLHDLLLDSTRLRIVALAAPATHVRFRLVRNVTGLSEEALAEQLQTLNDAGLVQFDPDRTGPARSLTWVTLTMAGRRALAAHTAALRAIAGQSSQT